MEALNLPLLVEQAAPRGSIPPTANGSCSGATATTEVLVVDTPQQVVLPNNKRKRLEQHFVATPQAPTKRVKRPTNKPPAQKKPTPKKPTVKKPAAAKMASLTALMAAMAKALSASAVAHKVVDETPAVDVAPESYADMLNEMFVDIDSPSLADYDDYNHGLEEGLEGDEFGEEEDVGVDEEDDLEELEDGAFDGAVAKPKGRVIRSGNCTEF
jgi:hypothetical protein